MKRIIAMTVCIALIAIMAISGTVAYLTDDESAVNVFQVGKIDIIQHEQERSGSAMYSIIKANSSPATPPCPPSSASA